MRIRSKASLALLLFLASVAAGADAERLYQLVGKVLQSDGKPFRNFPQVVFLVNALTPFSTRTTTGPDGGFSFKNLRPGMYTLMVAVPFSGEMTRTIEIGPSFADRKGRISTTILIERQLTKSTHTVSVSTLKVSDGAKAEYLKAQQCLAKNDTAGGIAHLKKAVELSPQFSAAWNNLGTIAYQSRNYAEAERCFRQALELQPDSYPPLVNLGGVLLSAGRQQEALTYNLRAVQARPDDALARSQLGQSYFFLDQVDLAEVELKKAVALDPAHFSFPQLVLAQIYLMKQNLPLAAAELEEFLKLHPDYERAPDVRKTIQKLRGKAP